MKLLITTATAALLCAGMAYAEGADSASHGAVDVNAAANSAITTGGASADLKANADASQHGAESGSSVHSWSALDRDASGGIALDEAQAFDPSVNQTAFSEFDVDANGFLDESEYEAWAAGFDDSAYGQGDADLDVGRDAGNGADIDIDGAANGGAASDIRANPDAANHGDAPDATLQ